MLVTRTEGGLALKPEWKKTWNWRRRKSASARRRRSVIPPVYCCSPCVHSVPEIARWKPKSKVSRW